MCEYAKKYIKDYSSFRQTFTLLSSRHQAHVPHSKSELRGSGSAHQVHDHHRRTAAGRLSLQVPQQRVGRHRQSRATHGE